MVSIVWAIGGVLVIITTCMVVLSRLLLVRTQTVKASIDVKIVVISDIHLGIYKRAGWSRKVADMINSIEGVDAVFVLGDWLYWATTDQIANMVSPLSKINIPMYAVLGNHDYDSPFLSSQEGGNIAALTKSISDCGIKLLDNTTSVITLNGTPVNIVALGDERHNKSISRIPPTQDLYTICIMHNPDSLLRFAADEKYDLILAGHTHNGQINIPSIYHLWMPIESHYTGGWYNTKHGRLFVGDGVGETGVPFRLFSLPTIDVISLKKQLAHDKKMC
jgi:uncharacterized protein